MGTLVRITAYAQRDPARAIRAAFARIYELEMRFSDYRPDSEVSRLRPGWNGPLSRDLRHILEIALRIAAATDGAFDITVGPLTQARRARRDPTPEERAAVGWRGLELRGARLQFQRPAMKLDLGGIAKGFAAQEALRLLPARSLVAVSGDLALGDPPPDRAGWRVEAQGKMLDLRNVCVSTSGGLYQGNHIIGMRPNASATVIAKDGAVADALATAFCIVDPRRIPAIARRFRARCLLNSR
jgi:thiamine biosynthesis lipoprotein